MKCKDCPLTEPRCSNGVGSKEAKIAIVGRNPGKHEASTGIPFTGPSGELLDAILQEVGLKRDDLWITNAVSCHVEGDDVPTPEMYVTCRGRLMQELAEVNPAIVLSFGNEATQSLLGTQAGSIMKLVGSMHPLQEAFGDDEDPYVVDTWVLPTFHPAYVLRGNVEGFDDLLDAVRRAKRLVDGVTPFPEPLPYDKVHYLDTKEKVIETLYWLCHDGPRVLAIDTETDFVRDPAMRMLLVQVGTDTDAWVFEAEYLMPGSGEGYNLLLQLFADESRTWIFHNAAFDLRFIQHYWGEIKGKIEDTEMLALCLDEQIKHAGLKRLVNSYLSVPHYEASLAKYIVSKKTGYSAIPREILVPYSGFDVIFTYRLFPVLAELVKKEGNYHNLYPLLVETQKLFSEMSYHGVLMDLSYKDSLRIEYEPLLEQLEKEMQAYAWGKGFRATDVVANAKDWPFLKVSSPKQLLYFLNTQLGFKTETTGRRFMSRNEDHEFVVMLERYRKVDHLVNAYVYGIEKEVWPDGRVHPDYMHGTVTGRTTIQYPALQTLPGDDFTEQYHVRSVRKMIVPSPGHKFVHADYSQLEIRVAWHITGDEEFGKAVMSTDFHRTMASLIYGVPPEKVTKYQRNMSKVVTFGMLYGRQAPSIARQMKMTLQDAKSFLETFSARFPKYFAWWEGRQKAAVETGVLTTEFGRRRRWNLITPDTVWEIQRQAVNFPIQSTASDITLTSTIRINKMLKETGWGRILFCVHDSLEMEILEEHVDKACAAIVEIMEHPLENTQVIFKVGIGVGNDYAEASNS